MPRLRRALEQVRPSWGLVKWTAAIALLGWLFYEHVYQNRGALSEIASRGIHWGFCAAAVGLGSVSILLTFVRWYVLVWAQEFDFRLRDAFRLGFVGFVLNYAAPGQVGGDLFKAVLIAREQRERRMVAVATVALDRILGLLALFMLGGVVSLLLPEIRRTGVLATVAWLFWGGTAAGVVGLLLLLHPAVPQWQWLKTLSQLRLVGRMITDLINAAVLYQTRRRVILLALVMSFAAHMGILTSFYFCARALRLGRAAPDYTAQLVIVPAAEIGASLVPVPGGVGALEGALAYFYWLLAPAGLEQLARAGGLLAALLFRLLTLMIASIGFGYYMATRREIDEAVQSAGAAEASRQNTQSQRP